MAGIGNRPTTSIIYICNIKQTESWSFALQKPEIFLNGHSTYQLIYKIDIRYVMNYHIGHNPLTINCKGQDEACSIFNCTADICLDSKLIIEQLQFQYDQLKLDIIQSNKTLHSLLSI